MNSHLIRFCISSMLLLLGALPATSRAQTAVLLPNQVLGPSRPWETDPRRNWHFGEAVSIKNDAAFVGLFGWPDNPGRVAVYGRQHGRWIRTATLQPADSSVGDGFGEALLGVDDDEALVWSATGVHVFHRRKGIWSEVQVLPGFQGSFASTSGFVFIRVGFVNYDGIEYVKVYKVRHNGTLQHLQTLTTGEGIPLVQFGTSMAAAGDMLVVGAYGENDYRGAAYVFERRGTRWVKLQKLIGTDVSGSALGYDVAADEHFIVASEPGKPTCAGGQSGGLQLFTRHRSLWYLHQTFDSGCAEIDFGAAFAVAERTLAIGKMGPDLVGAGYIGETDVYHWDGDNFQLAATAYAQHAQTGFGRIDLSAHTMILGFDTDPSIPGDPNVPGQPVFIGHAEIFDFSRCLFADVPIAAARGGSHGSDAYASHALCHHENR